MAPDRPSIGQIQTAATEAAIQELASRGIGIERAPSSNLDDRLAAYRERAFAVGVLDRMKQERLIP
jgi:hypothetical protein